MFSQPRSGCSVRSGSFPRLCTSARPTNNNKCCTVCLWNILFTSASRLSKLSHSSEARQLRAVSFEDQTGLRAVNPQGVLTCSQTNAPFSCFPLRWTLKDSELVYSLSSLITFGTTRERLFSLNNWMIQTGQSKLLELPFKWLICGWFKAHFSWQTVPETHHLHLN